MSQLTNLFKNPSFETNATGTYTLPGTTGVAPLTYLSTGGYSGADFVRATWSTASTATGGGMAVGHNANTGVERIDVVAATQYTATVWVRPSKAKTLTLSALVYNTTPSQVGSTTVGTPVSVAANTWTLLTVTFTTGTGGVRVVLQVQDTDATRWSIGNTLDVDAVMVVPGSSAPAYADPSTSLMWAWSGAAHASTSVLYTPSIVLNPYGGLAHTDADLPWCEVVITDVSPQIPAMTIWRTAEDRQFPVRGGINVAPGTAISVPDSECPSVTATYVAELLDASGNRVQFSAQATVTLGFTGVFIHQPLQPELYVSPVLTSATATEISRSSNGQFVFPEGATVGTWIGSGRTGIQAPVELLLTTAQADMFSRMLGTYSAPQTAVLCIRTTAPSRLPRLLFAVGPSTKEIDFDVMREGDDLRVVWDITEVRPPAPALSQPALGYDDLDFFYSAGYDVMDAAYVSYFDRDRDYSLAGVAP
ncbi:hypothetical protein ACFVU2_21065 [Leifsonia sp. NPDC058194]|uniref:hypothetical protein n=1 Tax=Leifsonia sp. NPDC058194 TaxID=3346374 RepID=UPI0036DB973E